MIPKGGTWLSGHGMPHDRLLELKKKKTVSNRTDFLAGLDVNRTSLNVNLHGGPGMEGNMLVVRQTATYPKRVTVFMGRTSGIVAGE